MKQTATNQFNDAMNLDLHPIVTPNSVLTDNLNGTFITYNGNEFCLQNDRGNTIKAKLSRGFVPIGIKEHNGILYIVSHNSNKGTSEIGTYPSPDYENESGNLVYDYKPLHNFYKKNSTEKSRLRTKLFNFDTTHPISIEIQDSYDGSINLILTDGNTSPKIINTGFSVIGNTYKLIDRTQDSNEYHAETFDNVIKLVENSNKLTKIDLEEVTYGGQLKGGNYTFYLRYGDEDGNKTDIICESGIVSIFKGIIGSINSISGTLADELTDKSIKFKISEIDTKFSKIYLSYSREYSDTNGYRMSEAFELTNGFTINKETQTILITGFEEVTNISEENLNITYHTISTAKAIAQQQDMLFFGNVTLESDNITKLQELSYNIKVSIKQSRESIGYVDPYGYKDNSGIKQCDEYYNPLNIYYKLGYWPDEYYRLGVVYIKSDGSKTPVFNLRGCVFESINDTNDYSGSNKADDNGFYPDNYDRLFNKYGVFKTPKEIIGETSIIEEGGIHPWYFQFELPDGYPEGIVGYFIVRQKRIPVTILQGLKIGIEADTKIPMLQTSNDQYITESFLTREISANAGISVQSNSENPSIADAFSLFSNVGLTAFLFNDTSNNNSTAYTNRISRMYVTTADGTFVRELPIPKENTFLTMPIVGYGFNSIVFRDVLPQQKVVFEFKNTTGQFLLIYTDINSEQEQIILAPTTNSVELEWTDDLVTKAGASEYDLTTTKLKLIYKPQSPTGETITDAEEDNNLYYQFITTNLKTSTQDKDHNHAETIYILIKRDRDTNDVSDIIVSNDANIKSDYDGSPYFYTVKSPWTRNKFYIWWDNAIPNGFWDGGFSSITEANNYYEKTSNDDHGGFAKYRIDTSYDNLSVMPDWLSVAEVVKDYIHKFPDRIPPEDINDDVYNFQDSSIIINHNIENIENATVQLGSAGLLSLVPIVNNSIKGMLDGSEISLSLVSKKFELLNYNTKLFVPKKYTECDPISIKLDAVYIDSNTNTKVIDNKVFVGIIGNAYSASEFAEIKNSKKWTYKYGSIGKGNQYYPWLVRGIYTPYIGLAQEDYSEINIADLPIGIYNVRKTDIDKKSSFIVRINNHSPFYSITELNSINNKTTDGYRGDCYTVTESHRMIRNFIDPNYPYTKTIIDSDNWNKNYKGKAYMTTGESSGNKTSWDEINTTDLNTVSMGHWVAFKCLANYNLGLRSIDSFHVTESSLLGTERKFYPLNTSTATPDKIEDSTLLNDGYNATLNKIRRSVQEDVPFVKEEYATRVMFSNKNVTDQFVNGYRVFQGLSYQDYDKQYGEIVKLVPWGNNLFCVFEHGLAILPINEKALLQTTTEQTIHIYGHGVLPEQMSIVSQDYGTKYADSVIRTPIGIYGVDVDAKKIWRFSDKQGFETLSDMKIETFLNHTLDPIYNINVGKCDVRTHYNSFKGDVIFTWYTENEECSICFNERQALWITRYNWIPIISENINGEFYSLQIGEDSEGSIGIYSHEIEGSKPTKWYGKQQPFEFEFVVSDPIGVHKIFENLQIISNNVQPEELQFEFIGDSYMFNKERLYHTTTVGDYGDQRVYKAEYYNGSSVNNPNVTDETSDLFRLTSKTGLVRNQNESDYKPFRNVSVLNDRDHKPIFGRVKKTENSTEQYHLVIPQECRNIETWGRRLGNIHYKFDSWYTNIEPILYDARLNDPQITKFVGEVTKWNSARIRDKWCKIRVRYSGEDLAVITAIKTMLNI